MKLQVRLDCPGCARGRYSVKAKGYMIAILGWADAKGRLSGWSPFAYVPIDPYGNGEFSFEGNRAIPAEATHVHARCIRADFTGFEELLAKIPESFAAEPLERGNQQANQVRISVLSDMHLASKPWRIRRALKMTESNIICLVGDSVNDGTAGQFEELMKCVDAAAGDKAVFPVIGNHDILSPTLSMHEDGRRNYTDFHNKLTDRLKELGMKIESGRTDLAYATDVAGLDIIGLQCVVSGRRFLFPEGNQTDWLEGRLEQHREAAWHIILCHAPLLAHNPNRNEGTPYLDRNKRLQEIVEKYGNIIFISGHTHVSPNVTRGCVEYDTGRNIIYINSGSVVTTSLERECGLMDPGWADGCVTELRISDTEVEISMRSVEDGLRFPRGYYRRIW